MHGALLTLGCMQGAVEWRKEIEEAVTGCNKFVAFIDLQYLLSYNCLEVSPSDLLSPLRDSIPWGRAKTFIIMVGFMWIRDSGANSHAAVMERKNERKVTPLHKGCS